MPTSMLLLVLGGLLLLSLILLVFCMRRLIHVMDINRRFSLTMSNAYEQVYELNLSNNTFYQYFILNGLFEKTAMHEPLSTYLPRTIREHAFQRDLPEVERLLDLQNLKRLSAENGSQYLEYRRLSPKGTTYWCSMLAQGLKAHGHMPAMVMLYICDIDETKGKEHRAHQRLTDALRNAERLSEVKTNFTGRVSHEIRTPLNAVMGYLTIARDNVGNQQRVAECLEKADIASHHLLDIVNDILDVNALESGKFSLSERAFKLRDFIGEIGMIYHAQAAEGGITFDIHLEGVTEEHLIADDMRLRQILMNLLSNALKFTPRGGHVELIIRQTGVTDQNVVLAFIVRDNGIGMRDAFLEHIFTPFEQEESATARRYGGSGLGLSIVKSITEMMGGTVGVESKYGAGSTFTVSLPLKRTHVHMPEGAQRYAISRLRVLAATDDRSMLELISSVMSRLGVTCDTAISGYVAAEKAEAAAHSNLIYNLILLDWDNLSPAAIETCRRIRAALGTEPCIAAITDDSSFILDPHREEVGSLTVVQKPLNQSILVDLLESLVDTVTPEKIAAADADLSGVRVLLVEDNRLNREIGRELLQHIKLTVDVAEDGQQGVDAFLASKPNDYSLILMDLQMPVMDGYAATKAIRNAERADAKTIPIIALTANAYPSDVNRSLASGMDAHLAKPIDPDALYALIHQYVRG